MACVGNGEAAIAAAEDQDIDLILMDIHLDTAMLGTEAAKIIMQRFGIPVLFLSAYTDDQTLEEASDIQAKVTFFFLRLDDQLHITHG